MRVFTFKADEELIEQLDTLAAKMGISRSELIRRAIKEFIERKKTRVERIRVIKLYR